MAQKNIQEDFNFPFAFIDLSHENTVVIWPFSLIEVNIIDFLQERSKKNLYINQKIMRTLKIVLRT